MTEPTWTILIATLGQRRVLFRRLMDKLMPQVDEFKGRVNVVASWDNGQLPLYVKRQRLLNIVTNSYVSFVDDDDRLTDDFVSQVMTALQSRPDYVGFWLEVFRNGHRWRMSHHSLRHGRWDAGGATFLRDITHINPMLTSVAQQATFRVSATGAEDKPWVDQVRDTGLLRNEVFINKVLYRYMWSTKQSAWRDPRRIKRMDPEGRPWEPLAVDSPNFDYLAEPQPVAVDTLERRILIIVPSRSRPQNVERMLKAWTDTNAWEVADLRFDIDLDDPKYDQYVDVLSGDERARYATWNHWRPSMHKLNRAAAQEADQYFALGFMGDDHCPETVGWAQEWLAALTELGTGIVYSADGIQDEKLPTQWAMTSDIVRAFGRMIPAKVEHLYCDNVVLDLGTQAGCIRYLGHIMIRHRHYIAKLALKDEQYARVNSREQFRKDRSAYEVWRQGRLAIDAARIRELRS